MVLPYAENINTHFVGKDHAFDQLVHRIHIWDGAGIFTAHHRRKTVYADFHLYQFNEVRCHLSIKPARRYKQLHGAKVLPGHC